MLNKMRGHLHLWWFRCWILRCSWSVDEKRLRTESLLARGESWVLGKETVWEWAMCSWKSRNSQTEVSFSTPFSTKEDSEGGRWYLFSSGCFYTALQDIKSYCQRKPVKESWDLSGVDVWGNKAGMGVNVRKADVRQGQTRCWNWWW